MAAKKLTNKNEPTAPQSCAGCRYRGANDNRCHLHPPVVHFPNYNAVAFPRVLDDDYCWQGQPK